MAVEALAWTALFLCVLALGAGFAAWFGAGRARVCGCLYFTFPLNLTMSLEATSRQGDREECLFALGILTFNVSHIPQRASWFRICAVDG